MSLKRKITIPIFTVILIGIIIFNYIGIENSFAEEQTAFNGIPTVTLTINNLDTSGNLIYVGIDIAVFYDPDGDGLYEVYPSDKKVKRILTRSRNITINLGEVTDYAIGVKHKLAYRTLYVPTGTSQDQIIIAAFSNGKEGWIPINATLFKPSFFRNDDDNNRIIRHTGRWNTNRQIYNNQKIKVNRKSEIREENVFWSGEAFEVNLDATATLPDVSVRIKNERALNGTEYSIGIDDMSMTPHATMTGGIYKGTIWNSDMINRWGNYSPKMLEFNVTVSSEGVVLEEKDIEIIVDNRDLFFRNYLSY